MSNSKFPRPFFDEDPSVTLNSRLAAQGNASSDKSAVGPDAKSADQSVGKPETRPETQSEAQPETQSEAKLNTEPESNGTSAAKTAEKRGSVFQSVYRPSTEEDTVTPLPQDAVLVSKEPLKPWELGGDGKENDEELPDVFQTKKKSHPVLWSLFWLLLGLLGGYVGVESVWLWQAMATMPTWLWWTSAVIWGILAVLVIVSFLRLVWLYWGMRSNQQQYLSELQLRTDTQQLSGSDGESLSSKSKIQICEKLQKFVRAYPANNVQESKILKEQLKKEEKTSQEFQNELEWLRKANIHDQPTQWLKAYQAFQKTLDEAAYQRVHIVAEYVGLKTAISPNPLWDMLIVFYWSFKLMQELCQLYHLRVNTLNTCRLVMHMWITGMCAMGIDRIEDFARTGMEKLGEMMTSNQLSKAIFGHTATKMAAGLTNYYLFRRLGRAAVVKLQPLALKEKPNAYSPSQLISQFTNLWRS